MFICVKMLLSGGDLMLSKFEKDLERQKENNKKLLRDIFGKYGIKGNFFIR